MLHEQTKTEVSSDASNHHYELPPGLFRLFLDDNLKYSVGLFESDEDTLELAQVRKMDYIAEQLGVGPGSRVLDIGCGWGSLSLHMAKKGCIVEGITPSRQQADYIEQQTQELALKGSMKVHKGVFEDQELPNGQFDAITFVGSIVHVPDKATALARAKKLLKRNGRLYLSETCFNNSKNYQKFSDGEVFGFIRDDIFGWGDCVPVSHYVKHLEDAGFSICGMRDLTADYQRTIEEWQRRALSNKAEIEAITPGYVDSLLRYFDICNVSWGYTTKQYAVVASNGRGRMS